MTIEEKIREEMMRLQELMERLEDFKSRHKTTKKCVEGNHPWVEISSVTSLNVKMSFAFWECDNCGIRMTRSYLLQDTEISDPWSDLREDEEE